MALTQSLIGRRPLASSGIGDGLHLLSAPLNHYLVQHSAAANGLLIVSSVLVDLLAIFVLAEWLFGRTSRPLLGLVIVLGLRQVVQGLCALPKPDNMIWHYPGFPSLLVTYGVANDYFFSCPGLGWRAPSGLKVALLALPIAGICGNPPAEPDLLPIGVTHSKPREDAEYGGREEKS